MRYLGVLAHPYSALVMRPNSRTTQWIGHPTNTHVHDTGDNDGGEILI